MPQYFLNGWVAGTPGGGSMEFALPPGTKNCIISANAQDEGKRNYILFNNEFIQTDNETAYNVETDEVKVVEVSNLARINWVNSQDNDVYFDYEITPLYASP